MLYIALLTAPKETVIPTEEQGTFVGSGVWTLAFAYGITVPPYAYGARRTVLATVGPCEQRRVPYTRRRSTDKMCPAPVDPGEWPRLRAGNPVAEASVSLL